MSVSTFDPLSLPSVSGLRILFKRLFSHFATRDRSKDSLRALTDHMLLDIGVDPRGVRCQTVERIERTDAFDSDLTALHFRITSKS